MMDNSVRRFTAIHIGIVLLMLLMGAMKPQLCYSEVPKTVNYQGYLTDSGGIPVDGDVDMEFSIYNVSSGGSSLWSESQTVTVQSGIYSVILGETNPINLTFDVPYYLAVKVGSDAEMTPRQPLTSVGYSFRAADADLLDGQDGSYYRNASNLDAGTILSARLSLTDPDVPNDITVDETNIASSIARDSEIMPEVLANDGSGSTLDTDFLDGQDGSYYLDWGNLSNVPVGFADGVDDNSGGDITAVNAGNGLTGGGDTDGVTLHVGAGTGISLFADTIALNTTYTDTSYVNENQGNSISSSMVQIPLSLSGSSSGAIISGDNTNTASGYGVWGEGDYGVYGKAVDSSGAGIYGQNFVDFGYNYGYLGGNTYAVYGQYGTSGPYGYIGGSSYGVYGYSNTGHGGFFEGSNDHWDLQLGGNIGRINTGPDENSYMILSSNGDVRVRLDNDGGESGVFRIRDSGSTDVCTVNESGDLTISGHLTKNTGSFRIDHPLDPKNKYLYHSFVESPDMKNIYDGVVELDENGEAWIEFPDWFEALNRDFRYQITPIGAPGPNLYVADEVSDNRFKIAGGDPGMKVSWQVTGIRQDPYANAHPISVEKDKPPEERGYYSHPELYGQPEQMRIEERIKHSGLDADLLDGQDGSYYLDWGNLSNVPAGFFDGVDNTDDTVSWDEISGIVGAGSSNVAAGDHDHDSDYAAIGHSHDASDITSGTLSDSQLANDLTINGGTIDDTVIGQTTAAAGSFTTLSASDTTNLGGTLDVAGTVDLGASGGAADTTVRGDLAVMRM